MARAEDMQKVARALGVNPQTVRKGLEQGCYPFGTAVKCDRGFSYQFFPRKVQEFLGVSLDERKD